MTRALDKAPVRIYVFILSMAAGAAVYLFFVSVIAWQRLDSAALNEIGDVELHSARFEGEFKLFAVTNDPVDLGYDAVGSVYFLDRQGDLTRCQTDSVTTRSMEALGKVKTGRFLPEHGCSAIAFHPGFLKKESRGFGKYYVTLAEVSNPKAKCRETTANQDHQEVLYEFAVSNPANPAAFPGRKREVLRVSHPADRDKSVFTELTFDHRGLLYIGVADLNNQKESRASELTSIYGKVLRIDPLPESETGGSTYRIPEGNPFYLGKNSLPELWSYGLRDPHSVAFDPFLGWLCISDSGREMFEEINVSSLGAEFFGWNLSEGSFFYPPSAAHGIVDGIHAPGIEYVRGRSVGRNVGGLIYRGERFPHLDGKAVFADENGRLLTAEIRPGERTRQVKILKAAGAPSGTIRSFKGGPGGELFALCENGRILELQKARTLSRNLPSRGVMLASAEQ